VVTISVGKLAIMDTISVFQFLLRPSEVSGLQRRSFSKLVILACCVCFPCQLTTICFPGPCC